MQGCNLASASYVLVNRRSRVFHAFGPTIWPISAHGSKNVVLNQMLVKKMFCSHACARLETGFNQSRGCSPSLVHVWSSKFLWYCLMNVFGASIHISSSGLQNLKAVGYYHEESFKFCPSNWDGRYPDEKDSSLINLWYACSL